MVRNVLLLMLYLFLAFLAFVIVMAIQSPYSNRIESEAYSALTGIQNKDPTDLPFTLKKSVRDEQYALFADITKQLTELKIDYWLTDETLNSAMCFKSLAPWDDRVTIGIKFEDAHKINTCIKTPHGLRFAANNSMQYPAIDIQLFSNIKDDKDENCMRICTPVDEIGQCTFIDGMNQSATKYSDIFPLLPWKLQDIACFVPKEARKWIQPNEGKSATSIVVFYNNRQTRGVLSLVRTCLQSI